MRLIRSTVLVTVALLPAFSADDKAVGEAVFVKDSEIYVRYVGSPETHQLTRDGAPKGFASLSTDGGRIAFVVVDGGPALGLILTMSVDGTPLRKIVFRPLEAHISGMRFIERIEWISDRLFVVSGSVNPSTGEYVVVDSDTGKETRWYLVDGFAWAASPDGSHAAYVGYIPHFTPEERRRPQLCIDDECGLDKPFRGFPPPSRHVNFMGAPVWSPDGAAVAIMAADYDTKADSVIVRPLRGKAVEFAPPGDGGVRFRWEQNALIVQSGKASWKLESGASAFVRLKP